MRHPPPYGESYRWRVMTMAPDQEEAVHPLVTQALAAEHVRDMRAQASARSLVRAIRRHDGSGRVSRAHTPVLRADRPAPQPASQPARQVVPAPRPEPRVPAGVGADGDD